MRVAHTCRRTERLPQLRGAIDPMGAAVATAAVGRATVTLRKAKPGVWGKLLAAGAKVCEGCARGTRRRADVRDGL